MLGNIEARSHLEPEEDPNPGLSAARKRIIVRQYLAQGAAFEQQPLNQGARIDQYSLANPPLGIELRFTLGPAPQYTKRRGDNRRGIGSETGSLDLHVQTIDLGDKDLYRQGFGAVLLQQAIKRAHDDRPTLDGTAPQPAILSTSPANLGLLNTIGKLAGGWENVSARMEGVEYGWGCDKPLEQALSDYPYDESNRYLFVDVEAHIDPEALLKS